MDGTTLLPAGQPLDQPAPRPTTTPDAREAARRARVDGIRDAAIVREHLGQRARYERLPDGRHQVSLYDHSACELVSWAGLDLTKVIATAKARRAPTR